MNSNRSRSNQRKSAFTDSILIACLFLLMTGMPLFSQTSKVVMGVPPDALLAVLPKAPENWKLVSSLGVNEISSYPALLTFAIREYRLDPPPPVLPGDPIPPPKITKITLLDTAHDPDRAFVFDAFQDAGGAGPNTKRFTVAGIPFVEQTINSSLRVVSGAFDGRFIISANLENQTKEDLDAWLTAINVTALNAWMKKAPELPPTPDFFKVSRIDELHPETNQTLSVAYLTKAQRKAEEQRVQRDGERESARQKALLESESRK
ncbi:MAG: hypothetical protein WCO89_14300, partial [Syntrophus sp. (in: bacteria)]